MGSRHLSAAIFLATSLAALGASAAPEPTAADRETARTLMRQGRDRRASHDLKGALESFQAADAIMHVPTTGYEVARAEDELEMLVEAEDTLLRLLRIPEQANEPEPFKQARQNARDLSEKLEARIPSVLVKVEGLPTGAPVEVTVDGVRVPQAALAVPRKVDPGHHVIVAKAGGAAARQELDLQEKEARDVTVTLTGVVWPPPAPVAGPGTGMDEDGSTKPPPPVAPSRGVGAPTWIAIAVTGAGLVTGGVTGLLSISHKNTAQSGCTPDNQCPPSTWNDIDAARSMATVSTIGFIVAGAGAAGVLVTLLLRPSAPPAPPTTSARLSPWVGVGGAGVTGEF